MNKILLDVLDSFLPLEDQLVNAAGRDLIYILDKRKNAKQLLESFYKVYNNFVESNSDVTDLIEINNIDITSQFPVIAEEIIRDAKEIVGDGDGFVFDFSFDPENFDPDCPNHVLVLQENFKNTLEVFKKIHKKRQFFAVQIVDQEKNADWDFEKNFVSYDQ